MNGAWPCDCLDSQAQDRQGEPRLHDDLQDLESEAWKRLLELVERASKEKWKEFAPARELGWEHWSTIVQLPRSISTLKKVRLLNLYGSKLVRIPPEIGDMTSLVEFHPYTSYRLHWFPYEITRCRRLKDSGVSTRALYGNYKYRTPFPSLDLPGVEEHLPVGCSVCQGTLPPTGPLRRWISLRVATDILPLLVHACSEACIARLPRPAEGYVQFPHLGGSGVQQPAPRP